MLVLILTKTVTLTPFFLLSLFLPPCLPPTLPFFFPPFLSTLPLLPPLLLLMIVL